MGGIVTALRKVLEPIGVYHRLRASRIYDAYWRIAEPEILHARDREVEFYRSLLRGLTEGDLIYDIGANHGYKTDIFLRLGARVVAVDPDPANHAILTQKFRSLRLVRRPVTIVQKAVSREKGHMTLWIDEPGSAKNTLSPKWVDTLRHDSDRFGHTLTFNAQREVETTTIADMIEVYGRPFFIKIDVEGHELDVILGMREPVPYLSFEVNLPEFLSEGLECVKALDRLGPNSLFNYSPSVETGLALPQWLPAAPFSEAVSACGTSSIEVFCATRLLAD
ncbi:MAG TPA: FkbM family methyltransferase [Gammaproteobacteria bacterium]